MKTNPTISEMFFDWLKKTHSDVHLHPFQEKVAGRILNQNLALLVGHGTGKTFLFNLIEEFLRNENLSPTS